MKTIKKVRANKAQKAVKIQRNRSRRIRSLLKKGIDKEQIQEWLKKENNRFILCLVYNSFTIEDNEKKLHGVEALNKFCENNKLNIISTHKGSSGHAGWILSDVDHVDEVIEMLKPVGRTSITKPEPPTKEKEKKEKKPSNNTKEAKTNAKKARKNENIKKTEMRAYHAALRKGGVKARIKKYNPTLAEKIEKWIEEKKKSEATNKKKSKEYRAKHRQLTSLEMKANKRARKEAKHLATQERRKEREKKQMEYNAKLKAERARKASNGVQTELKIAA